MKGSKTSVKKTKDLPAKSSGVKGGGAQLNDNITLVRSAKPTPKKKDMPTRKPIKGGMSGWKNA